jgi:hypothetical protein
MKKKVKLFYGIFALFVLALAILDLNNIAHLTGNVISEQKEGINDFSITIDSYTQNQNQINLDYTIYNAALDSKNIEINYQFLDLNGNYIDEGTSEVVFNPSSTNSYRLTVTNNNKETTKVRIFAFNGYITAETERVLNIRPQLTGFTLFEDKENTSNLIIAILLIGAILFVSRKIYKISTTSRRLSAVKDNLIQIKVN